MAFHVFGHIEALQRYAHRVGKLFGDFGFADAGRAGEEEAAYGFVGQGEAGARHFDGGNQRVDGVFLTVNHVFQIAAEELQHLFVSCDTVFSGIPCNFGNDGFDLRFADDFFLFGFGQNRCAAPASSITSMALSGRNVVDVAGGSSDGGFERTLRIAHLVEIFKHWF